MTVCKGASHAPIESLVVTAQELAESLKISIGTIYYWVSRNEVPFIKMGRHLRFNISEVLEDFKTKTREARFTCNDSLLGVSSNLQSSLKIRDATHADLQKKEK